MNTQAKWGEVVPCNEEIELWYRGEWIRTQIISQAWVGNDSDPSWHVVCANGLHWHTGQYTPEYHKI